jgi:uncharacterized membrane protein
MGGDTVMHTALRMRLTVGLLWLALESPARAQGMTYTLIDEDDGLPAPQIYDLSDDGSTAVGIDWTFGAFRYRVFTGILTRIPGPPGGGFANQAEGVSRDGNVVVGVGLDAGVWQAFRYSDQDGTEFLGSLAPDSNSYALAVSNDGSVVVGYSANRAFRWTAAGGMIPITGGPSGDSWAPDVSGDGSVVVGTAGGSNPVAFRWTQAQGMQILPPVIGHNRASAFAISEDGSAIVGQSFSTTTGTYLAVYWVYDGETFLAHWLSPFPGATRCGAENVSGNGKVILGRCLENDWPVPFVWSPPTGMLRLADYAAAKGLDFSEVGISDPWLSGVSDDGGRIAGYHGNVSQARSFLLHPPAPPPAVPALPLLGQLVLLGALTAAGVRSLVVE